MTTITKGNLALVSLCVVTSVLASFLMVICVLQQLGIEVNQEVNQTVNVNTPQEKPTRVNLNTATFDELKSLPGIGDILAQRIIDSRPFTSSWELADISGIGGDKLQAIMDKVEV